MPINFDLISSISSSLTEKQKIAIEDHAKASCERDGLSESGNSGVWDRAITLKAMVLIAAGANNLLERVGNITYDRKDNSVLLENARAEYRGILAGEGLLKLDGMGVL